MLAAQTCLLNLSSPDRTSARMKQRRQRVALTWEIWSDNCKKTLFIVDQKLFSLDASFDIISWSSASLIIPSSSIYLNRLISSAMDETRCWSLSRPFACPGFSNKTSLWGNVEQVRRWGHIPLPASLLSQSKAEREPPYLVEDIKKPATGAGRVMGET